MTGSAGEIHSYFMNMKTTFCGNGSHGRHIACLLLLTALIPFSI